MAKKRKVGALKLKNPRTSVGAGALNLAELLSQPATAPGLMSPSSTRTRRSTLTLLRSAEAACDVTKLEAAVID